MTFDMDVTLHAPAVDLAPVPQCVDMGKLGYRYGSPRKPQGYLCQSLSERQKHNGVNNDYQSTNVAM